MRSLTALGFVAILVAMLILAQMSGIGIGKSGEPGSAEVKSRAKTVEHDVNQSLEKARERLTRGIDQAGAE